MFISKSPEHYRSLSTESKSVPGPTQIPVECALLSFFFKGRKETDTFFQYEIKTAWKYIYTSLTLTPSYNGG